MIPKNEANTIRTNDVVLMSAAEDILKCIFLNEFLIEFYLILFVMSNWQEVKCLGNALA